MNITMVKKLKVDGQPCAKSARVLKDLEERGLLNQIHQIVVADERNPSSEGYTLAAQYNVESAPFFLVNGEDGSTCVYKAYYRFLKDLFNQESPEDAEVAEIMAQNPDLDFI
ncbi:MAG: hypothetical protein AB4426_22345 [Xenococcaceae cyanobacterium]